MIIMMMMMTMLKAAGRSVGDSEECLDCEAQGCAGGEAGPSDDDDDYIMIMVKRVSGLLFNDKKVELK